jgi:hypothetical protein
MTDDEWQVDAIADVSPAIRHSEFVIPSPDGQNPKESVTDLVVSRAFPFGC